MKEMEQETKVETQEEDQKDDKQEEQTSAANLPKTQEELDALIEGRIKREHRKWSRQQAQQSQDTAPPPTVCGLTLWRTLYIWLFGKLRKAVTRWTKIRSEKRLRPY